jgi:CS domain
MSSNEEEKDDDMTLKEREDWLKARGVQIENPRDRTAPRGPSVIDQLMVDSGKGDVTGGGENAIPFVFCPSDDTRPLQTVYLPASVAEGEPGDALPNYVKPYFASDRNSIDASMLREQATKHFAGGDLAQLAETKLSPAAMNAVAAQGSVETFALVHPADTNQFQGVYIYLDEVGLLKKLPHNPRASQIATACGYNPPPNFYGDVFIGRVQTKPNMTNVAFVAGVDTDRGAAWMQRAVSENLFWQQEMNQLTGQMGKTQPAQIGTDGKSAVEEQFEWTQDDDELEIVVPSDVAWDKKSIKITFLARLIKVKYQGEDKFTIPLYGTIDVDGCTWTLEGDNRLVITCEKASSGEMWPRIKT